LGFILRSPQRSCCRVPLRCRRLISQRIDVALRLFRRLLSRGSLRFHLGQPRVDLRLFRKRNGVLMFAVFDCRARRIELLTRRLQFERGVLLRVRIRRSLDGPVPPASIATESSGTWVCVLQAQNASRGAVKDAPSSTSKSTCMCPLHGRMPLNMTTPCARVSTTLCENGAGVSADEQAAQSAWRVKDARGYSPFTNAAVPLAAKAAVAAASSGRGRDSC
jgi:hypothetical protein